ncbi:hypothetical protein VOLCADRAFT_107385 [Volvox carteri f. nagariensis]|uniref:Uncharacterized protein n=1 Tax=Volvox carteri f. nagariensis TaxID=3068 RepID=D8UDN8_VOLCA|nr:uncharacterized protein VOLCADRAFT_107385 [Volvox carteri f. nagariensis]EFJ42073.1 hypothetical protein VOLCADRAFT_107385 [Volvox carteri f. nagariensis]|eukprot:XP_002956770.1 hypothetical protein VOLCADRAFT_107385 [Volvox carteri f. nagariensis]
MSTQRCPHCGREFKELRLHLLRNPYGCKDVIESTLPGCCVAGGDVANNDKLFTDNEPVVNVECRQSVPLDEPSTGTFEMGVSYLDHLDKYAEANSEKPPEKSLSSEVETFLAVNLSGCKLQEFLRFQARPTPSLKLEVTYRPGHRLIGRTAEYVEYR